jgi:predicted RecB family nuclease
VKPLSKSRYLLGLRCHKLLWLDEYEPDGTPPDAERLFRMREGIAVGERARAVMGDGVLIKSPDFAPELKLAETQRALDSGAALIFEAMFTAGGAVVRTDILRRTADGFDLIEVKSSTSIKDEQLAEVAMQLWVLRAAGLSVPRAFVMHLNGECRFPDLANLFVTEDVTEAVEPMLADVAREVAAQLAMLDGPKPEIAFGAYCKRPEPCERFDECWSAFSEYHIHTLYRIQWKSIEKNLAAGRDTIDQMDESMTKVLAAKRQIRSVRSRKRIVEAGLGDALDTLKPPVAWLDFETVALAIPVWPGCAPFTQVPVQFSVHWTGRTDPPDNRHQEYLAVAGEDPRPALAAELVRVCDSAETIVAYYASFEKGCIERLAEAVPVQADALRRINDRIVDLLPILRDHVYDPAFHGSFSLKKVLPALVPSLSYADLDVKEGGSATVLLAQVLLDPERIGGDEAVQKLRHQLLEYCERDTEAMVRLAEALRAMS